jgi:hypothetical protein
LIRTYYILEANLGPGVTILKQTNKNPKEKKANS